MNLIFGGVLYLAVYLRLVLTLGAVDKHDILILRTLMGSARMVARLLNPVFDYELGLVSAMKRD